MRSGAGGPEQVEWGNAIDVVIPTFAEGGTHVNVSGAAVAKNAPNKDNAVKFLEFLASDEAQAIYAKANFEYPVKPGAVVDPIIADLGELGPDSLPLDRDRGAPQGGEPARRRSRLRQLGGSPTMTLGALASDRPRLARQRCGGAMPVGGRFGGHRDSGPRPDRLARGDRRGRLGRRLGPPRRQRAAGGDAQHGAPSPRRRRASSSRSAPGAAWLVTAYDFPGRRVLDWALLLPLAVPTYIVAYAYLDLLHPIGPVQTLHPGDPRHRLAARFPPARHPVDPGRGRCSSASCSTPTSTSRRGRCS